MTVAVCKLSLLMCWHNIIIACKATDTKSEDLTFFCTLAKMETVSIQKVGL